MVMEPAPLDVNKQDVDGEWLFVPADGKRGSGKRVEKRFPVIPAGWIATFTVYVLDDIITKDVLVEHVGAAGKFIGIGRFRPRNNGFYGRFAVEKVEVV